MFSLGKWGDKARYSKIHVGLVGTFNVVLSTVIAFGMCCAMGIMLTPISQIVPFLLLGIGIDDMFVIVRALELVPESAGSVPTRMKIAMRDCGGSITVTSVTDAIAFCVGANRQPVHRSVVYPNFHLLHRCHRCHRLARATHPVDEHAACPASVLLRQQQQLHNLFLHWSLEQGVEREVP